jgi:hypothetical protein
MEYKNEKKAFSLKVATFPDFIKYIKYQRWP